MSLWSLWLRSCAKAGNFSSAIAGNLQSLENFIDSLQHERKSISIQKAWLATDRNSKSKMYKSKIFDHHWVILQCSSQDYTETIYFALHRFDGKIHVRLYEDFDDALQDSELRPEITRPIAKLVFESMLTEVRPARRSLWQTLMDGYVYVESSGKPASVGEHPLLARYIVPALRTQLKDYNVAENNCQHFSAFVLKCITHAGEYLGLTKNKTMVSKYGELTLHPGGPVKVAREVRFPTTITWLGDGREYMPDLQMQEFVYNTINQDFGWELTQNGCLKLARSDFKDAVLFSILEKTADAYQKKQAVEITEVASTAVASTAIASTASLEKSAQHADPAVIDDCGCVKMGCCLFVTFGVLMACLCVSGSKAKKSRRNPDSDLLSLVGQ